MVIHAKLLTFREELGGYIVYVFENLETGGFEICTRVPRWETPNLEIGDIGYLKFKEVIAGLDTWYNGDSNIPYRYTEVYFEDFVHDKKEDKQLIMLIMNRYLEK